MIYVALFMLLWGTLTGWMLRGLWDREREGKLLRAAIAAETARQLAEPIPTDAIDYIEVEFFEGRPKVTLLPGTFDGRA